ncbi:response regulator transcription factor [Fodinibius sp. AD559]|uniref:response regulator transcription factor n=1 Tax=Fodinibius sp. AD559 TaxID=3424179 RepID=UPI004046B475
MDRSTGNSSEYINLLKKLTPREVEILEEVAKGRTSKEIGEILNLSYRTVQKYRQNICEKLGIKGYRALFKWCLKHMKDREE